MTVSRDIRGKRPSFFDDKATDQLMSALVNLLADHWVLRERLFVVERLAERKGLFSKAEVELFELSDAHRKELNEMRQALLQDVFRSLREGHHGAEDLVKAADESRSD